MSDVGCLEKRLGQTLEGPKDFLRNHPFNNDELPAPSSCWRGVAGDPYEDA
jgi:hypothetical protein